MCRATDEMRMTERVYLVIERKRSIELFFRILRRARMIPGSMRGAGESGGRIICRRDMGRR